MIALLVGRFHAVTLAMEQWLSTVGAATPERCVCVLTSANQRGTRRNPFDVAVRRRMLEPALSAMGAPFVVVPCEDVPESERWVPFVLDHVAKALGRALLATDVRVFSQNRDVAQLFMAEGFDVEVREASGLTPQELLARLADGRPWQEDASQATRAVLSEPAQQAEVKRIFSQRLLNDDGELGHLRDFKSYGAQMDASLKQKLDDLLPWVKPGCIVDKGCGTGKLLVELSRVYPSSAFVGVDLSREFLRQCDENTYASEDVSLVFGNAADVSVPVGTASTVILSSVAHEIYSYAGYSYEALDQALRSAATELAAGGHLLMRDGISPGTAMWRMRFLNEPTRAVFDRFAEEFKHGAGAQHERLSRDEVRLSAHFANEFLCKKDYLKNWHIEVHEEFGVLTLDGWRTALERAGFEAIALKQYVNEWIAEHRYAGTVALTDDAGARLAWPATNAIVVGRKK